MKNLSPESKARLRSRSRLVHLGRDHETSQGFINLPPFRGSTVLFPDVATMKSRNQRYTYGTHGTPTTDALCEAWTSIAGAAGTVLVPTGMAAIAIALMSALGAGDHVLMTDSAYQPTRTFCEGTLKRMSVETTYYDPRVGPAIGALFAPTPRLCSSNRPARCRLKCRTFPPLPKSRMRAAPASSPTTPGARRSTSPRTPTASISRSKRGRNISRGHADLLLGLISANAAWLPRLSSTHDEFAIPPGPEDTFLALRGLRTMELRLREAERQSLALAEWLRERAEVLRVLHPGPARPPRPRAVEARLHRRLGSVQRRAQAGWRRRAVAAMLDGLELFGIGYSWGGFESLVIPFDCARFRTATRWAPGGPALRFSVGLEDIDDLKDDLTRGFARLSAAG